MEPKYITFEQAKWLKEKGFNEVIKTLYNENGTELVKGTLPNSLTNYYSAPEQHQVVDWLLEKHGIWIEVRHIKTFGVNRFHIIIWKYGEEDYHTIHCGNGVGYEVWDTPQEAYSAAFDYIKYTNLI